MKKITQYYERQIVEGHAELLKLKQKKEDLDSELNKTNDALDKENSALEKIKLKIKNIVFKYGDSEYRDFKNMVDNNLVNLGINLDRLKEMEGDIIDKHLNKHKGFNIACREKVKIEDNCFNLKLKIKKLEDLSKDTNNMIEGQYKVLERHMKMYSYIK